MIEYLVCDLESTKSGTMRQKFVNKLAVTIGRTLESLSVTAQWLGNEYNCLGSDDELEDTFDHFKVLTHLELDTKLFILSSAILNNTGDDCTPIEDIKVPRLGTWAPPTLNEFVLHMPATAEDYTVMTRLFDEFESWRHGDLPYLQHVEVVLTRWDVWSAEIHEWEIHTEAVRVFCLNHSIELRTVESRW